ncbi:hypothetical protein JCGZ_24518 [Jatropha curcas]|uniref:Uncharacterized protein n=1 Tax=Jatropha curcas TaxID=180498 RepID=A0A067L8T3_JATCU|nr:uncharacterized protein LOC105631216 [Jatropha curcas]KDP40519.1 hypothetical protein JCGZ_24518 [Jatropha curcas]
MASRSHVALSTDQLDDSNRDDSLLDRSNRRYQKEIKESNFEFGWAFVLINLVLEMLILTFDQMASLQEPQYGLVVWGLCFAMMLVCASELIYKGIIKEKLSILQCLKSLLPCSSSGNQKNPYSFFDGLILLGAKIQTAFASIGYGYLLQGKDNPIKVSFVSLIFLAFFLFARFFKNRKEATILPA